MSVADVAREISVESESDEPDEQDPRSEPTPTEPDALDSGSDVIHDDPTAESESSSIISRLTEPMEGSIREDRIGDLWNPEEGGANRALIAVEETVGLADGLPRAVHIALGAAEWYYQQIQEQQAESSESSDADAPDLSEIDTSNLEAHV